MDLRPFNPYWSKCPPARPLLHLIGHVFFGGIVLLAGLVGAILTLPGHLQDLDLDMILLLLLAAGIWVSLFIAEIKEVRECLGAMRKHRREATHRDDARP